MNSATEITRVLPRYIRHKPNPRDESGFALPTAMLMLLAAFAIVGVGVVSSLSANTGARRDQDSKAAIEAAEAGVDHALLHYNRIAASSNLCLPVTTGLADANGWCPAVTGTIAGSTFSYRVKPTATTLQIVSTGTRDAISRRVNVTASSASGSKVFSTASVKGVDHVALDSNAFIQSNVATNGYLSLNSNAQICGSVSYGVGGSFTAATNASQSCGAVTQAPLSLPPVNQGNAPLDNDNGRLFAFDTVSGNRNKACFNGRNADGSIGNCGARELALDSNVSVTLGGSLYSLCKLTLASNSALYIAAGHAVTIYFDTPENCGLAAGSSQMVLSSNSRITSTTGTTTDAAFLFTGSATRATTITLNSNTSVGASCLHNFVVYAPLTDIHVDANATYCGALAGKTVDLNSYARIYADSAAQDFSLPLTDSHFTVNQFIECTPAAGATPSVGC